VPKPQIKRGSLENSLRASGENKLYPKKAKTDSDAVSTKPKEFQGNLISSVSWSPDWIQEPYSWTGHMPFAYWLMAESQPKVFVELGTHTGNSYFSFCQAVREKGLNTRCYAVDTWQGDEQAGFYGCDVFELVNQHNESQYKSFSILYRMTFDEALAKFQDQSVDLLHIDGLHTYEAVRHDFETWLPKLAPGAVVLFHDIKVTHGEFGVWKFWHELREKYPENMEFRHSHGLGVIRIPGGSQGEKPAWLKEGAKEQRELLEVITSAGESLITKAKGQQLERFVASLQSKGAKAASEKPLNLELFFAREGEPFSEEKKISEPLLCHDNQPSKTRISLQGNAARSVLWRIDPGCQAGRILIRSIKFFCEDSKVVWDLQDDRERVLVGGTASALPHPAVGIELVSTGNDPAVILPKLPSEVLPVALFQIELEIAPLADAIDALAKLYAEKEGHQRAVLTQTEGRVKQLEESLDAQKVATTIGAKELGESLAGFRQGLIDELRELARKIHERQDDLQQKNLAEMETLRTTFEIQLSKNESNLQEVAEYAGQIQDSVIAPSSYMIPAPFSWYAYLYKMLHIKKPVILNEKKSSSVAPKRPGFWRRLERSIRKRRKNYINQLGFDEKWYLNEYPDVAAAKCDPWTHYRDSGIHEGRYKSKKEKEKVLNQKGLQRYGPRGLKKNIPALISISTSHKKITEPTFAIFNHEATVTGAPILGTKIYNSLCEKGNGDLYFLKDGPLVDRSEKYKLIESDAELNNLFLDDMSQQRPEAILVIANSIESRKACIHSFTKNIPSILLVHELPSSIPNSEASFVEGCYYSDIVCFSSLKNLNDVKKRYKPLKLLKGVVIPQGYCGQEDNIRSENDCPIYKRFNDIKNSNPQKLILIGAGTVCFRKGPDLFIEVAAEIDKSHPEQFIFIWFGKGFRPDQDANYSSILSDMIYRHNLTGKVFFFDETKNFEKVSANSDALLLTSRVDPHPIVADIGFKNGKPVFIFAGTTGLEEIYKTNGLFEEFAAGYLNHFQMSHKILKWCDRFKSHNKSTLDYNMRFQKIQPISMSDYTDKLSVLGVQAKARVVQKQKDLQIIIKSKCFRPDFATALPNLSRDIETQIMIFIQSFQKNIGLRKPFPGFDPYIYRDLAMDANDLTDPLAHYITSNYPQGSWNYPVCNVKNEQGANLKSQVALHIHLFYPEMLAEITSRIKINKKLPDLFISIPKGKEGLFKKYENSLFGLPIKKIFFVDNIGRDVKPFLDLIYQNEIGSYDFIGHIHTKKSAFYNDETIGVTWNKFLLNNLLGASGKLRGLDFCINQLIKKQDIGMIFPDDPNILLGWDDNYKISVALGKKLQIEVNEGQINFPIGNMFWCRQEVLKIFQPFEDLAYPAEPIANDGTELHAIERLFGYATEQMGWKLLRTNVFGCTR
jgi:glycosyltransferase involved in cell wall biosynthesis